MVVDSTYRGHDRRSGAEDSVPSPAWRFAIAGVVVVALIAAWLAPAHALVGNPGVATASLRAVAIVMTGVVAASALLYGDMSGDARALRVGAAVVLRALGLLLVAASFPVAGGRGLSLAAALWAFAGVLGPPVDVRRTVSGELARACALGLPALVLGTAIGAAGGPWAVLLDLTTGLAWLAVVAAVLARPRTSPIATWVAVPAAGFAYASLVSPLAADVVAWSFGRELVRASALSLTALGCALEFARAATHRRRQLHDVELRRRDEQGRLLDHERDHRHELRNAVLAVEGAGLTLARYHEQLDPEVRAELSGAVEHGFARLRRLLAMGETDGDRHRPGDLVEVLRWTRTLALEVGVRVVLSTPDDEPCWVAADEQTIGQMLDNLVRNAHVHGGADLRTPIRVEVTHEDGRALVRVSDAGPGIPEGCDERVFERGWTWAGGGEDHGLGLYLARDLARKRGGELTVEPSPVGACFRLELPLARALRVAGTVVFTNRSRSPTSPRTTSALPAPSRTTPPPREEGSVSRTTTQPAWGRSSGGVTTARSKMSVEASSVTVTSMSGEVRSARRLSQSSGGLAARASRSGRGSAVVTVSSIRAEAVPSSSSWGRWTAWRTW